MVETAENGQRMCCPKCGDYIENKETDGVVFDGTNSWHSDCWYDWFGESDIAYDGKMLKESEEVNKQIMENMDARERRKEMVKRWATFEHLPPGRFGARKIA